MFTVIYQFKVLPGKSEEFIHNWSALTKLIYQFENSYGSRLHRNGENNYVAYAQWPNKETWQNSGDNLPEKANKIYADMKACCEASSTDFELEVVSDLLHNQQYKPVNSNPRAIGIGGIFFKAKNQIELKQWYADNLGMQIDQYGSMFTSLNINDPKEIDYLQWSIFKADSNYFEPSDQAYMINYRVYDLVKLAEELKANGVEFVDKIETFEYGKFLHILDLEGNKIELWEPTNPNF